MKKNIALTGFMGTGKTAVSRELSRLTGFTVVDVDAEIEKTAGMTITEIFARFGEPRFREMETEAIRRISAGERLIISTGGGAVLREENMEALRRKGVIICLWASPEIVLKRTSGTNDRPLLRVDDPLKKIKEMLEFRRPYYEKADMAVDTEGKSPLRVAEEILERIKGL
jgi:shikimate kinase